jgi:hypothetical protein
MRSTRPGAAARAVRGRAVPQLDCALVVRVGLGERREAPGLGAGLRGGRERGRQVVRRVPVVGQLGGDAGWGRRQLGLGLERARQRGVQRAALARQQVVDERLAHERVAEAVGAGVGIADDDVVRHRLAQARDEVVRAEVRGALEQAVAHPRPGDRGDAQRRLRGRAQRLDPQHQRVDEVRREPLARGRGGQLLGEERVALGARE